jgi:hypothetical protein
LNIYPEKGNMSNGFHSVYRGGTEVLANLAKTWLLELGQSPIVSFSSISRGEQARRRWDPHPYFQLHDATDGQDTYASASTFLFLLACAVLGATTLSFPATLTCDAARFSPALALSIAA